MTMIESVDDKLGVVNEIEIKSKTIIVKMKWKK